ncbi:hypothetical protein GCM10018772_24410 [Streptomyces fumanus]|uniref:Uncharacterized protein n=1 Tax=Streptomyces fumanus TaxID=67302 RepID=A0A919AC31_9ACTN|nr:hypothetical protein GCM10018772_24410 [Streptomyces fumanus]
MPLTAGARRYPAPGGGPAPHCPRRPRRGALGPGAVIAREGGPAAVTARRVDPVAVTARHVAPAIADPDLSRPGR